MDEQVNAVIIDNGSNTIKCGFANDDAPRCVFPSMIGCKRHEISIIGTEDLPDHYAGDEAWSKRGFLRIKYPIEDGIVTNYDYMEKLWQYSFNKLQIAPEEHAVLLTEDPITPKSQREKMTQIMFETFSVPATYVSKPGVLAAYASGRTTAQVLGSGYGSSRIIPIYEGYALPHAMLQVEVAGRALNSYISKLLLEAGYTFSGGSGLRELMRKMKEMLCYVAEDFEEEMAKPNHEIKRQYQLPDGQIFEIGNPAFRTAEALFQPSLVGISRKECGIHELIRESIQKCDVDIQADLYKNIILCGGTTMLPGIANRLSKEVTRLASDSIEVDVIASGRYSAWIGGSILSALSTFQDMWIQKEEYDEFGPCIVHRKCTY